MHFVKLSSRCSERAGVLISIDISLYRYLFDGAEID